METFRAFDFSPRRVGGRAKRRQLFTKRSDSHTHSSSAVVAAKNNRRHSVGRERGKNVALASLASSGSPFNMAVCERTFGSQKKSIKKNGKQA